MESSTFKSVVVLAALMCAAPARAQELPNAVDLKAAYCIRLISEAGLATRKIQRELHGADPNLLRQVSEKGEAFAAVNVRLQAYLLPRMPSLEMLGVMAAANQASTDTRDMEKLADKCASDQSSPACQNQSASAYSQKLKSCQDLSWLPF
jgi:hypothetical protein